MEMSAVITQLIIIIQVLRPTRASHIILQTIQTTSHSRIKILIIPLRDIIINRCTVRIRHIQIIIQAIIQVHTICIIGTAGKII